MTRHAALLLGSLVAALAIPAAARAAVFPLFDAPLSYEVGAAEAGLAAGDLNGDGLSDVVVAAGDGNLQVLLGRADRPLVAFGTYADLDGTPILADFDNDGALDLTVAQLSYARSISVLMGNGDGTFRRHLRWPIDDGARRVFVADLDGDGLQDLLLVVSYGERLDSLAGNGDGTFRLLSSFAVSGDLSLVAVGDTNGDGLADLLFVDWGRDTVLVYLNQGGGSFVLWVSYSFPPSLGRAYLADLTADGTPDLTVTFSSPPSIWVHVGAGDGTFGEAIESSCPFDPGSLLPVRLDGDGAMDWLTSRLGRVAHLRGDGAGRFVSLGVWALPVRRSVLTVGDFGGDGRPDLAVTDGARLSVWRIRDDGSPELPLQAMSLADPAALALGDLDGDHDIDLVATSESEGWMTVAMNRGDGTFAPGIRYPVGGSGEVVMLADIEQDGDLDAAVLAPTVGRLAVALNLGNGAFFSPYIFFIGGSPESGALVDFDGDGEPDLAVSDNLRLLIAVRRGHGNGAFGDPTEYPLGLFLTKLTSGDFDGDGRPDLAAINTRPPMLAILLNEGDGRFATPVRYSLEDGPTAVSAADFDGDGRDDLAAMAPYASSLTVLLGYGAGGFAAVTRHTLWDLPSAGLVSADIDADGILDLAVPSGLHRSDATILFGSGSGWFGRRVRYAVGPEPQVLAFGDLDGDGDSDIASANAGDSSVTVVLNRTIRAPLCRYTGDVDGNGVVTGGDAQRTYAIALGAYEPTAVERCAADCNGDGVVTAADAQAVFTAALGLGRCRDLP